MKLICACLVSILVCSNLLAEELPPQRLLEKADQRFYPAQGTWSMTLKTTNLDRKVLEYQIDFYSNGPQFQTAVYNFPALVKGTVAMKNSDTIYFKDNRWPKPQILGYQAVFVDSSFSYGDVLSVHLASDYTVESSEPVDEAGLAAYRLTLRPKHKGLYAKIEVIVDRANLNTLRRTYYTASGDKEKESTFGAFTVVAGRITGFHVEMKNLLLDLDSSADISNLKEEKVSTFLFDPQNIGRIHGK